MQGLVRLAVTMRFYAIAKEIYDNEPSDCDQRFAAKTKKKA